MGRGRGRGRGRDRGGRGGGRGQGATTGFESASGGSQADVEASASGKSNAVGGPKKRAGEDLEGENDTSKVARVDGGGKAIEDSSGVKREEKGAVTSGANEAGINKKLCTFYLKGRCGKGEECTFSHDVERKNCRWVAVFGFMSYGCAMAWDLTAFLDGR